MAEQEEKDAAENTADELKAEATEENSSDADAAKATGGKNWLLIGIVAVALLGGGGAGGYFFLAGGQEPAVVENKSNEPEYKKPLYQAIGEEFMVNLVSEDGRTHYLKVSVTVMSRNQSLLDSIKNSEPVLKSELLTLFGEQSFEDLITPKGKKSLRQKTLDKVQEVVAAESPSSTKGEIERVLFTTFIME